MVLIYFQVYLIKMKITHQIVEKHGLSLNEYEKIKKILKREPWKIMIHGKEKD